MKGVEGRLVAGCCSRKAQGVEIPAETSRTGDWGGGFCRNGCLERPGRVRSESHSHGGGDGARLGRALCCERSWGTLGCSAGLALVGQTNAC